MIDNPTDWENRESHIFEICQGADEERILVYDWINDYFKVTTAKSQLDDICPRSPGRVHRCHLMRVVANVTEIDNHDNVYIEIVPKWDDPNNAMHVEKAGITTYGKVYMSERPRHLTGRTSSSFTSLEIQKL